MAGVQTALGMVERLLLLRRHTMEEVLREVPGGSVDEVVDRALRRLAQRPVGVEGGTVTERLASFITGWAARGLPPEVTHEAKRLIINNLKASVRARDHDFVRILLARTEAIERGAEAHVLWHGTATSGEQAALINAVQMEVFDFNETHVPSYVHLSAPVLPAVLACGEAIGAHGGQLLDGLALGIEVELAVSTMLMPTAYERGFLPGVIAGTVGAAAGCASILRLSHSETCNAIAIAMLGAGGLFEAVGSMTASYLVANAARNGYVAAQLAARGVDAPTTAFEGEKGMLLGFSVADPGKIEGVMEGLGTTWRMRDGSYKRYQAETIDQAPLECLFTIRERTPAEKLASIAAMRFHVEPLVANIAKDVEPLVANIAKERYEVREARVGPAGNVRSPVCHGCRLDDGPYRRRRVHGALLHGSNDPRSTRSRRRGRWRRDHARWRHPRCEFHGRDHGRGDDRGLYGKCHATVAGWGARGPLPARGGIVDVSRTRGGYPRLDLVDR